MTRGGGTFKATDTVLTVAVDAPFDASVDFPATSAGFFWSVCMMLAHRLRVSCLPGDRGEPFIQWDPDEHCFTIGVRGVEPCTVADFYRHYHAWAEDYPEMFDREGFFHATATFDDAMDAAIADALAFRDRILALVAEKFERYDMPALDEAV